MGEATDNDAHIVIALFMDFLGQQATLLDFERRIEMTACIVGCCRKMRLCSSRVVIDALAHVTLYFAQFLPLVQTPLSLLCSSSPSFQTPSLSNNLFLMATTLPSLVLPPGSRSLQQGERTHRERAQRVAETWQMGHVCRPNVRCSAHTIIFSSQL